MEDITIAQKISYVVFGGITLIIVKYIYVAIWGWVSGKDRLVKYSAMIKRASSNILAVEEALHSDENIRSIIVRGVDAVYVAVKGKSPTVVMLNLRKEHGAMAFINGLACLNDPEKVHDIATGKLAISDEDREYFKRINIDIRRMNKRTWFRLTDGRDVTDDKIDAAMVEQVKTLAKSKDKAVSHSGACHIAVKWVNNTGSSDVLVLPTSFYFREVFANLYDTDDLSVYNGDVEDLFEKILTVRKFIYNKARGVQSA